MRAIGRLILMSVFAIGPTQSVVQAQATRSGELAAHLTRLLDVQKLDVVAAPDPREPGRFVAALYFQGSQLLVISAEYPVPALIDAQIKGREFRQIYMDLQSASPAGSRFFVHDMEADGLRPTCGADQPVDAVFEGVVKETTFDGDWLGQGLTESEYRARFAAADERYARMLSALVMTLESRTT